jgi:tyrosyl-tRNA synthetase
MKAREDFDAHFSRRHFADVEDLPSITDLSRPVVEVVKGLGFAGSNSEVRRVAEQKGLRLVVEPLDGGDQEQVPLGPEDIRETLSDVLAGKLNGMAGRYYLRVGRKLARIEAGS